MLPLWHLFLMSSFLVKLVWTLQPFTAFCLQNKCTLLCIYMDIILVMWVTFSPALCFDVESTRLSPVLVISWSFITLFCICKCDPLYSITVRCKALVGVREYGHTHRPLWLVSWQSLSLMVKHLWRSMRESSNTVKLLFNALSKARPSIIRARGIQPMYR